jgi:hypothetical protein
MMRRRRLASSALTLALCLALVGPATTAQDTATPSVGLTPTPPRGANMAFTLIEVRPSLFTGGYDVLRQRLGGTWVRRALTLEHDAFVAMLIVSDGDVSVPLFERMALVEANPDVRASWSWLGGVVTQRAGLYSPRFEQVGFIVAAQASTKPEERPRTERALARLAGVDGVVLTARGAAVAEIVVFYRVGTNLREASTRAAQIDGILTSAFLDTVAEGVALPVPG